MTKNNYFENNSLDQFIGGKISLYQPKNGYRANVESILLGAAIHAKKGQNILELGCGVGAVLCSLMCRIEGLNVVGIESQKRYATLAARNIAYNGFTGKILECDISALPSAFKKFQYDHVVFNPPFFRLGASMRLKRGDEDIARREQHLLLKDWLDIAIKRCAIKGEVVLIHEASRLDDIIKLVDKKLGNLTILPISSFSNQNAKRILVKGKKGSSSPLKILPPLVMHEGSKSYRSSKKYTDKVESILRLGEILLW